MSLSRFELRSSIPSRVAVTVLLLMGACAAPTATETTTKPRGSNFFDPVLAQVDGLTLRRCVSLRRAVEIDAALEAIGAMPALPTPQQEQLARNGLRLQRIPTCSVEGFLADVEPLPIDVTGWHGQVVAWRVFHVQPLSLEGRALAVDGITRSFGTGNVLLLGRSWIVSMEADSVMTLDLAIVHQKVLPPNARYLEPSKWEATRRITGLEISMSRGWAYVLRRAAPVPSLPASGPVDPGGAPGQVPLTIGAFLMGTEDVAHGEELLLFLPGITDRFDPSVTPPVRG